MNPIYLVKRKAFILGTFWFTLLLKMGYSFYYSGESAYLKLLRIFAVLVFGILSFFSLRNRKRPTVIMGGVITLSGLGGVIVGAIIPLSQTLSKLTFILVGSYFLYGGIRLILLVKK